MRSGSPKLQRRGAKVRGLAAVALATGALALITRSAKAQSNPFDWDPMMNGGSAPSGGSGTWDLNNSTNWLNPLNASDFAWPDSNGTQWDAIFGGTAGGNVSLVNNLGAIGVYFKLAGYTIAGTNTLFIGNDGIDNSLAVGTTTISVPLTLNAASGSTNFNSAAGTYLTVNGSVSAGGAVTLSGAGNNTFNSSIALNGDIINQGGGTNTFNGSLTGTGDLVVTNSSTVIMTGVNGVSSYSGSTYVQSGILQVGTSGSAINNILPTGNANSSNPSLIIGGSNITQAATVIFNSNQQVGSLYVRGNEAAAVQTITINGSNTTLSVGAPSNGSGGGKGAVVLGSAFSGTDVTNIVFNGGGNLVVNGGGTIPFAGAVNFNVGNPGVSGFTGPNSTTQDAATVDMRGLTSFIALGDNPGAGNAGFGTMHIGDANSASGGTVGSTLYLAPTSEFTTGRLDIEEGAVGTTATMKLGDVVNDIGATNIFLGAGDVNGSQRSGGNISFNSSSGSLVLRGGNGPFSSGPTQIDMDSFYTNYNSAISTTGSPVSVFDVSGHQSDINIGEFSIGWRRGGGAGGVTDTFSFGGTNAAGAQSNLNVSQLFMGVRFGAASNSAQNTELATVNLEGGTATIGSVIMANNESSGINGTVNAFINISGGNVSIGTLTMATSAELVPLGTNVVAFTLPLAGFGNAAVNISGGNVTLGSGGSVSLATASNGATCSGALNITGGSVTIDSDVLRSGLSSSESGTVLLNGASALLDMTGHQFGNATAAISTKFEAGTLQNVLEINGGTTPLTKIDNGSNSTTLVLAGTSSYTDGTLINGGVLSVSSDANLGNTNGAVTLNAGASDTSALLSTGTFTSARAINLNSTANANIIDATSGNTLTLTGTFGGSGDLTKGTNAGTLQLANPSGYTFSGNVNAFGGTLAFGTNGGSIGPVNVPGALNVSDGAVAQFLPSTTAHVLNTVNTLNLNNTGLIDLSNSDLSVNNSLSQVRSYLAQAYAGGAWTGTSGITSSVVEANPSTLSIAYVSGANTNNAALNPALTNTSAVLLRPSLIGDFNLDGKVDRFDIRQFNARNAFNDGLTTHDWADGDLNGDGKVDRFDIRILNASNNFNSGNTFVAQAQTLSSSVSPATGNSINNPTTVGTVGDGKPDLLYNPSTGDVVFSYDGYNPGTGKELVEIDVQSSKSDLNPSGANTSAAQFVSKASNDVDYQDVGTGIADGVDLGTIMPVGSTPAALTNGDIVVNLYLNGEGTSNKYADITSTPEPTTLSLMGLAAAGLLGRRRKNKAQPQA